MADDLSLICDRRRISGWTEIRVTRGVERLPSDFDIALTERFPGEAGGVAVKPGDPCQVLLGDDVVITGYVDRVIPSLTASRHQIRVVGRGKCQDLVDCAAEWPGGQISGATVLGIAQKLAAPYGITVSGGAEVGPPIPQQNVMWGETAFELIERLARFRALLAYDGPDGNLILARVGSAKAASGFEEGKNVEAESITYSMDQRFSDYVVRRLSMSLFDDAGGGRDVLATFKDPGVPRHRARYIIAETGDAGYEVARQRGAWEAARRAGRSMALTLVTDSWRDAAGTLWQPNTLVPLALPALKLSGAEWVVSEVTYRRDERGTKAGLLIMPPEAFEPEPILLFPTLVDVPAGIGAPRP